MTAGRRGGPARIVPVLLVAASMVGPASLGGPSSLGAQERGDPLAVGTPAPEFALVAATAKGVLDDSVRPSDFRGQTLILAFYPKARSRG